MTSMHYEGKPSFDKCITSIYQEIRNLIEEDIEKKKQKYRSIEEISVELSIAYGDLDNKIVQFFNKNIIDMIIIKSNGLHGLAKKGLGSVSKTVSENADCHIVIIR